MKNPLLVKFETKSARVKALSFHPKRPWILAGLHDGTVQLWDYRVGTLVDKYDDHTGPVRGVHFHPTQPMFVTCGDDYTVRVFDYIQKKCLFVLHGHLDYVRSVQFHHELPWIISSSDDLTIRIWNWLSRSPVHIISGHSHYVMSARFHPTEPYILSASLDGTARVWDYTGLISQKQSSSGGGGGGGTLAQNLGIEFSFSMQNNKRGGSNNHGGPSQHTDIFGNVDVIVKHILEGHTRGLNFANFHPTLPLIVTASDDAEVKVWKMTDEKCWVVDTLHGHSTHVSSVIFHNKKDFIISNSEDKSLRIWDVSKANPPVVVRRENEKFWIIESHPLQNYIAAGHDGGLMIFKLQKERPATAVLYGSGMTTKSTMTTGAAGGLSSANLHSLSHHAFSSSTPATTSASAPVEIDGFVYKEGLCYKIDLGSPIPQLTCIFNTQKKLTSTALGPNSNVPNALFINPYATTTGPTATYIAITTSPNGKYDLYTIPKATSQQLGKDAIPTSYTSIGKQVAFVSSSRFAVFDGKTVTLRSCADNEIKRKIGLGNVTALYPGNSLGSILLKLAGGVGATGTAGAPNTPSSTATSATTGDNTSSSSTSPTATNTSSSSSSSSETTLALYDVNAFKIITHATLPTRFVPKQTLWSHNNTLLAITSKSSILIYSNTLQLLSTISEPRNKIKSIVWDPIGVLIYATSSHLKYALPTGESGILRTIETPFYLISLHDGILSCIDRSYRFGQIRINPLEYIFKKALIEKNSSLVAKLLLTKRIIGQAIVSFVQEKGYSDIALHFLTDPYDKFKVSLVCGNFAVAFESALILEGGVSSGSGGNSSASSTMLTTTSNSSNSQTLYSNINMNEIWTQLAEEAENVGMYSIAEKAWLKIRDFHRLTLLYTLIGSVSKLPRMGTIAFARHDFVGAFQASLFTGDIHTRIQSLRAVGLLKLAYITAIIHEKKEEAEDIYNEIVVNVEKRIGLEFKQAGDGSDGSDGSDGDNTAATAAAIQDALAVEIPNIDDLQSQLLPLWCIDLPPGVDFSECVQNEENYARLQQAPAIPSVCHPLPIINSLANWKGKIPGATVGIEGAEEQEIHTYTIINSADTPQAHDIAQYTSWPLIPVYRGFDFTVHGTVNEHSDVVEMLRVEREREREEKQGSDGVNLTGTATDTLTFDDWGASTTLGSTSTTSGKKDSLSSSTSTSAGGTNVDTTIGGDDDLGTGDDFNFDLDLGDDIDDGHDHDGTTNIGGEVFYDPQSHSTSINTLTTALPQLPPVRANIIEENMKHISQNTILAAVQTQNYSQAMYLLRTQIGVSDFTPFKQHFLRLSLHTGLTSLQLSRLPHLATNHTASTITPYQLLESIQTNSPILRNVETTDPGLILYSPILLPDIYQLLQQAKLKCLQGESRLSLQLFQYILTLLPFLYCPIPSDSTDVSLIEIREAFTHQVNAIIQICSNYLMAISVDSKRIEESDSKRKAELSLYATTYQIDPEQTLLYLWLAMKFTYGIQNLKTVAFLCRRILEIAVSFPHALQMVSDKVNIDTVKKMLRKCESITPTSPHGAVDKDTSIRWDPTASSKLLTICTRTFIPLNNSFNAIVLEKNVSRCSYCKSTYAVNNAGSVCNICNIGMIGGEGTGLKF